MHDLAFGLRIAALGMGIIFGLLALLWAGLVLIGRLDAALVAREEAGGGAPGPAARDAGEEQLPPEALAAVAIAVATHAALVRREAAPSQRAHQPGSQLFASRWLAAGRTRQTRAYGSHGRT
ncbi:MAG: OadG family protein [Deltaproteobacteria bacterium]|nr:OadG family protein [Deltaproteobacteria bacterium]